MTNETPAEKLIIHHQRRLQKLKEERAIKGINTPPEILTEIEDIEAEIEKLQVEIVLAPMTTPPNIPAELPQIDDHSHTDLSSPNRVDRLKPSLSAAERASLQRRLENYQENLRLYDERIAEYAEPTDVPLTLLKNKARVQQQIEDLTHQLGLD